MNTCKELCELYVKFNKMYITSKQESYTENDLNKFEVKAEIKIFIKFGNINILFLTITGINY